MEKQEREWLKMTDKLMSAARAGNAVVGVLFIHKFSLYNDRLKLK